MDIAQIAPSHGLLDYVIEADLVVQGVLLLLLLMSATCWAIIAIKFRAVRRAQSETVRFLDLFWNSRTMEAVFQASENYIRTPLSGVFRAGYGELAKVLGKRQEQSRKKGGEDAAALRDLGGGLENIQRSLQRASTSELTHLESMVPFLATTGSTAPFIGLFGTVWGIMNTFMSIHAKGATNIAVVAPGIAEALIATAVGLFAAIPAVIFYNHFLTKIRRLTSAMDNFSSDFLNIVRRNFFSE